ncbi:MAG: di-trans,poly-cis-decaprenylcistransferase [Chloroflexi bacterium RBG_16_48_7]|nr:MAG: di-trans,poly-cis-decaprenylcistransferase [Chloroflexi bacterium RBG_16_48_7]
MPDINKIKLPKHVAIVMDGNGRWARKKHQPRLYGHKQGAIHARDFIEIFSTYNIPFLTLYVFSTENWSRPKAEVDGIMRLLKDNFNEAVKIAQARNIRIRHLGQLDRLSPGLKRKAAEAIDATKDNTGLTVNIAFNYGGRTEIIDAGNQIAKEKKPPGKIDENLFSQHLYTKGIPDPDLIIRTSDEMRLSNFLIWQAAYAELYFTPVLWPDFGKEEFEKALLAYNKRQRRFGGLRSR